MKATNVHVNIEVEADREIVVVLDRQADCILIPWQDAYALADTVSLAVADARNELDLLDAPAIKREQNQIRLGIHGGLVALIFERTDRICYSWRSAELLEQALRIKAQDAQFAQRQVFMPTLRPDGKLQRPSQLVR